MESTNPKRKKTKTKMNIRQRLAISIVIIVFTYVYLFHLSSSITSRYSPYIVVLYVCLCFLLGFWSERGNERIKLLKKDDANDKNKSVECE